MRDATASVEQPPLADVDGGNADIIDVAVRIVQQGVVRVQSARLYRRRPGVACICVDMRSKYARLSSIGGGDEASPSLMLAADARTLKLDTTKPKAMDTMVEFPEYIGWSVFAAEGAGRYTLRVCLVAPDETPSA